MGLIDSLLMPFGFYRNSEKAFFRSRNSRLGSKGAVYISTEAPYNLYNSIPELKAPVNKIGAMFSNATFHIQDKKTEQYIDDQYKELLYRLENPNITQSQNQWTDQYIKQTILYGNQFMYKNVPSEKLSKVPSALVNVSPANVTPELTGKFYDQTTIDGIIKQYVYSENGTKKNFETKDIMWSKIADLDNPILGCSLLKCLEYPLTNTKLAYDYLNVISGDKGAIGMLSTSQKDGMGAIPMLPDEKKKIEDAYTNTYGLGENKQRIHVTEGTVTWTPMTYPTQDLLLIEQIENNFLKILHVLGVNPNIYINSTYENLKHGLISTYQDTIFPYADGFTQALSKFLLLPPNHRIVMDYSHIAILKTDEKEEVANFKTMSDAIKQLVDSGIISPAQGQEILVNEQLIEVTKTESSVGSKLSGQSPLVATKILESMTTNERRALAGLGGIDNGDIIPTAAPRF